MNKANPPTASAAIQMLIEGKPFGDYMDVVNEVQKQFGLIVSQREVEETYLAMKQQGFGQRPSGGGKRGPRGGTYQGSGYFKVCLL